MGEVPSGRPRIIDNRPLGHRRLIIPTKRARPRTNPSTPSMPSSHHRLRRCVGFLGLCARVALSKVLKVKPLCPSMPRTRRVPHVGLTRPRMSRRVRIVMQVRRVNGAGSWHHAREHREIRSHSRGINRISTLSLRLRVLLPKRCRRRHLHQLLKYR